VVINDLDHPLGVLELHLLLVGNVLLAFMLAGRHAVAVRQLLLLLTELLRELLDPLALLSTVAPGVVQRAPWPAIITTGGLARSLVTAWATTFTDLYGKSGGSESFF
jgi:hypothetical protein